MTIHTFGQWSTMRFTPLAFRDAGQPPAFYLVTSRICRGAHDPQCREVQTLTMGPLALDDPAQSVWECPDCGRSQPSTETGLGRAEQVCLFCSQNATVVHPATDSARTGLSSVAALVGAATTLHQLSHAHPAVADRLVEGTGDTLRIIFEQTASMIRADYERAQHAGTRLVTEMARVVLANARTYASDILEPFPVKDTED